MNENASKIDRKALFGRHDPVYRKAELNAPLSLGNGKFCYTVDFTGMQTFFSSYSRFPLCTMSEWGWHSYEGINYKREELVLKNFDTYGRDIAYPTDEEGQEELFYNLRQNPHKFNLGVLGLDIDEKYLNECTDIKQHLNLWEANIDSSFKIWGESVNVKTFVPPNEDSVYLGISSSLLESGKLRITLNFPYGSHEKNGSNFTQTEKHSSEITGKTAGGLLEICRKMDGITYYVRVFMDEYTTYSFDGKHGFVFGSTRDTLYIDFCFADSPSYNSGKMPQLFSDKLKITSEWWEEYWLKGGALELNVSPENKEYYEKAKELERRIVLSQYLMAIQNRNSLPPAETGLTCNSWYGKFHLEMHYWHSAQYPLWNRGEELEKSLKWYKNILEEAKNLAKSQGYKGARWLKMCGPLGDNSPSKIAVLLAWQQPHPILMAELCYRQNGSNDFLLEYLDLILETAEFMLSYIHWDGNRYVLGPPLIPAQERFDPVTVLNPGYEVEYFRWAFLQVNIWLKRLGMEERQDFIDAAKYLSLPVSYNGVYPAHENCPNTFNEKPFNTDHPSMLAMLGILPGMVIEKPKMNNTLDMVLKNWDLPSCWGWDFPMMAMCAARLGRTKDAFEFLLMDNHKNTYLPNGHNAQADREDLPLYLPGNGALLLAAAMMAAGWDDDDGSHAPGFPDFINVTYENLNKYI